jgi:adenylate kinase family enzyme
MRLSEFINHNAVTEGVNDPHTFKAVFMAGSPGAGKTTIARKLFAGTGLRPLNVDRFWQLYQAKGLEPDYDEFWKKYQQQDEMYVAGRLGLLIDGTAKNPTKMEAVKQKLEDLGYETAMVFVNTDLETAVHRAEQRAQKTGPDQGREIDYGFIKDAWTRTQQALGNYQSMFGNNFFIVDNNLDEPPTLDYAESQLRQWMSKPPRSPIARKWMEHERTTEK